MFVAAAFHACFTGLRGALLLTQHIALNMANGVLVVWLLFRLVLPAPASTDVGAPNAIV